TNAAVQGTTGDCRKAEINFTGGRSEPTGQLCRQELPDEGRVHQACLRATATAAACAVLPIARRRRGAPASTAQSVAACACPPSRCPSLVQLIQPVERSACWSHDLPIAAVFIVAWIRSKSYINLKPPRRSASLSRNRCCSALTR